MLNGDKTIWNLYIGGNISSKICRLKGGSSEYVSLALDDSNGDRQIEREGWVRVYGLFHYQMITLTFKMKKQKILYYKVIHLWFYVRC
jgi:hypothetical protein